MNKYIIEKNILARVKLAAIEAIEQINDYEDVVNHVALCESDVDGAANETELKEAKKELERALKDLAEVDEARKQAFEYFKGVCGINLG